MNTNNNAYTVIYSIVLVVLVAAILAFVAISLQPKQNENIKLETVTKVISAATATFDLGDGDILETYTEKITDAFYINGYGERVGEMNMGKENVDDIEVPTTAVLKRQNDLMKKINAGNEDLMEDLTLPVFVFDIDGTAVNVLPCYGAGLWGPIWGYIAVANDGQTIVGAVFDHKSETPGLGAKIAEEPFSSEFPGKVISRSDIKFSIAKNNGDNPSGVDAITGASMTSRYLGICLNTWFAYYEPYLINLGCETSETAEEVVQEASEEVVTEESASEGVASEESETVTEETSENKASSETENN